MTEPNAAPRLDPTQELLRNALVEAGTPHTLAARVAGTAEVTRVGARALVVVGEHRALDDAESISELAAKLTRGTEVADAEARGTAANEKAREAGRAAATAQKRDQATRDLALR